MIKKYLIDLDYREASFKGAIDQRNRIRDYLQRNNVEGNYWIDCVKCGSDSGYFRAFLSL